ncbi:MAG: zinc ribbon domain-containing protein [Halanaeroarchaeum sp.]
MSPRYRFDCAGCELDIVVDAGVRADFLESGCPICGAPSTADAFEEIDAAGDTPSQ